MIIDFEEFKKDEWYKTRPQVVKDAIEILLPIQFYMFKDSKKELW